MESALCQPRPESDPRATLGDVYCDRLQIWLPDTSSPDFAAQAHRQSLLAARSPHAEDDQAFVDSISEAFFD